MSLINGTMLLVRWLQGYYDAERQSRRNSVPHNNCCYSIDRGIQCSAWAKDHEEYCARHKADMLAIDALEKEVNEVIRKAQEK